METREIKFRGKRPNSGKWITGGLYVEGSFSYILHPYYFRAPECSCEVLLKTVGQYTGLKDKNGKEIYEGDVVRIDGTAEYRDCVPDHEEMIGTFKIETDLSAWGYEFDWTNISGYPCSTHIMGDIEDNGTMPNVEIIGNIHENPELL